MPIFQIRAYLVAWRRSIKIGANFGIFWSRRTSGTLASRARYGTPRRRARRLRYRQSLQPPRRMSQPKFQTQLGDLVEQMRIADPKGTIYLGIYKAAARFAVPKDASYIYGFLNDFGRMFVIAETQYQDRGANLS